MKTNEFKNFINYVEECSDDDPIWWAGYMFINLTEKQSGTLIDVLCNRFVVKTDDRGRDTVMIPSGIKFVIKHR